MKAAACFAVLLAFGARADEPNDRAAIERLIAAFNDHLQPPRDLFAADAPDSSAELDTLTKPHGVWSEVSAPHLLIRSIHFENRSRAVVDADNVRYGSVNLVQHMPVSLVVKRQRGRWKIFSLRVIQP